MTGGKTGSKTGSETGSEMERDEFMLGFRVPTTCGKKTSITTYSGEVSPPPANQTTTQCVTGGETGSETGGKTGSKTGGKTGSETGGETGSETGSKTGGETGGKTGFVQWICVLSRPLSHSLSCPLSRF